MRELRRVTGLVNSAAGTLAHCKGHSTQQGGNTSQERCCLTQQTGNLSYRAFLAGKNLPRRGFAGRRHRTRRLPAQQREAGRVRGVGRGTNCQKCPSTHLPASVSRVKPDVFEHFLPGNTSGITTYMALTDDYPAVGPARVPSYHHRVASNSNTRAGSAVQRHLARDGWHGDLLLTSA